MIQLLLNFPYSVFYRLESISETSTAHLLRKAGNFEGFDLQVQQINLKFKQQRQISRVKSIVALFENITALPAMAKNSIFKGLRL